MTKPKLTMIYDNGLGDVSTCSLESELLSNLSGIYDHLDTLLQGVGFSDAGKEKDES